MKQISFSIRPVDHIYCDFVQHLAALDLVGDSHTVDVKEIIMAFKKKAFHLMPLKHAGLLHARSRYQNMMASFLKVRSLVSFLDVRTEVNL